MPRQSHLLVLAALGLVALVAGAAWWLAEPSTPSSEALEPEAVEPETPHEDPLLSLAESSDVAPEGREAIAVVVPEDALTEIAIADDTPARRAKVKATLVDAGTSEPLPEYAFDLLDSRGERFSLVTDAQGRFEADLHAGLLRARFSESGNRNTIAAGEMRIGEDGEPEPLVLRVASGPTYRLSISPSGTVPLEDLRARLVVRGMDEPARASGTVRAGEAPWARFGPLVADAQREADLTLVSRDGVWLGAARVAFGPGVRPGVVSVVLNAHASVDVRVVDPDGRPVEGATVDLYLGTERRRGNVSQTNEEGRAKLDFLSGTEGNLVVRRARFLQAEQPIVLEPGNVTWEDVRLVRAPSAGAIHGIVLSDTGRYDQNVRVRIVQSDQENGQAALSLDAEVEWTRGHSTTGHFSIEDVPPGRWNLSISERDWFDWEPRTAEIEAPLEGFQLRVHDAVTIVDLYLRPQLEDGQAFRQPFEARITSGSTTEFRRSGTNGLLMIQALPTEKALRWRVDAPGFAPEIGDWSSFATEAPEPHEVRERRATRPVLVRGWGELYRVTRSDNRRPVEGAVAVVDGRDMGKTDKDGRLYVRTSSKPASVTFRYRDWKLDRKIDLGPPRSGSREMERAVRLQVPKPKAKK